MPESSGRSGGSVVVRRQLGSKLRQLRIKAGKDLGDVAEAGIASRAKMSRVETGKLPIRISDIRTLCWLYGCDVATTEALVKMAPGTQADDWLESGAIPDHFALYAGLEAMATRMRGFELEAVNGLLQTEDYATEIIRAHDPRVSQDIVERRVKFRMDRQSTVLGADPAPALTIVHSESVLLVGSLDVMAAQVEHLRSLALRPNIDVLVLPFSAGAYPQRGSFMLLDFDRSEDDPSVAYVEGPMGSRYYERDDEREEYEYVYDILVKKSIPIKEWRR